MILETDTGLSEHGAGRARAIMALEKNLREAERVSKWVPHAARDPELYALAVFGEPGGREPPGRDGMRRASRPAAASTHAGTRGPAG
jgi:hypothetical protein